MSAALTSPPPLRPVSDRPLAGSLRPVFEPRTVAVVGVSRRRGSIGAEIFHNLARGGFTGRVVPVNAHAAVVDVVDDCIAKRVGAIVVISAGFGETGGEGRARELGLRDRVRAAGIRMIGPNCM